MHGCMIQITHICAAVMPGGYRFCMEVGAELELPADLDCDDLDTLHTVGMSGK